MEKVGKRMDKINWLDVLVKCKEEVQEQIGLYGEASSPERLDLGLGAGGDKMEKVDVAAEGAIIDTLREHDASFTLVSEESGVTEHGSEPQASFITIDPIDGTKNFLRGIPFYATSIAVSDEPIVNTVHTALVADLFHDITFTAQVGRGAYRNGRKIAPSKIGSLKEAVIGLDLNVFMTHKMTSSFHGLFQETRHIRHLGANALEVCYVADGTIEAFIDIRKRLRATDLAAAWLILREAGAEITAVDGEPLRFQLSPEARVSFVAAANREIRRIILDFVKLMREAE